MTRTFIPGVRLATGALFESTMVPETVAPVGDKPIKFRATAIPTAKPTPTLPLETPMAAAPAPTDASIVESLDAVTSTLPTGF